MQPPHTDVMHIETPRNKPYISCQIGLFFSEKSYLLNVPEINQEFSYIFQTLFKSSLKLQKNLLMHIFKFITCTLVWDSILILINASILTISTYVSVHACQFPQICRRVIALGWPYFDFRISFPLNILRMNGLVMKMNDISLGW